LTGTSWSRISPRAIPGVEHVDGSTYRRTVVIDGDPGVLELYSGGSGSGYLLLRVHLPHWGGLMHIVSRARRIASLDEDLAELAGQLGQDPVIGPLLAARPGIRVPGTWDPFEAGMMAIIGEQADPADAAAIGGRIGRRLGEPVPGLTQFGLTHTFPGPRALDGAELTAAGLAPRRAAMVLAFAARVASGQIRLDCGPSLDELVRSVTAIEGVRSAAAHALAWRMGEPDACPATGLAVAHWDSGRWRPWRALAVAQLMAADRAGQRAGQQVPALAERERLAARPAAVR
jgi:AraC family transcriptional regulator, regulatory protein of adaptative response / DNA-3-methyladenine glycosylase II